MQTVIAGSKAAVDKACELLKANGAKRALLLPVSAPFHSSLMKPAAEALREKLAQVTLRRRRSPWSTTSTCGRDRRRPHPRRPVRAGLRPGALGRERARHPGAAWRGGRVRPRQGAGRHGAKRIAPELEPPSPCTTRPRSPKPKSLAG
jgi:hypothetical protein